MLKWICIFLFELISKGLMELGKILLGTLALMWIASHMVLGPLWLLSEPDCPLWVPAVIYGIPYIILFYYCGIPWLKDEWGKFVERHRS